MVTPQAIAGKAGTAPEFTTTDPQPPELVNPVDQLVYAELMAAEVEHAARFGSVGQFTVNGPEGLAATVKVAVQL